MKKSVTKIIVGEDEENDQQFHNQIYITRTEIKQTKRSILTISCDSKKTTFESKQSQKRQLKNQYLKIKENSQQKLQRICQKALILMKILRNKEKILKGYNNWLEQLKIHKNIYNDLVNSHNQRNKAQQKIKKLHQLINNAKINKYQMQRLLIEKKITYESICENIKFIKIEMERKRRTQISTIHQQFLPHLYFLNRKLDCQYLSQLFQCYVIKQQQSTIDKIALKKSKKSANLGKKILAKQYTHNFELIKSFNQDLKISLFMFMHTISLSNPKLFLNKHSYKNLQLRKCYHRDLFKQLFIQKPKIQIESGSQQKIAATKIIRVFYQNSVIKTKCLIEILVQIANILTQKIQVSQSKVQFIFQEILYTFLLKHIASKQQFTPFTQQNSEQFQFLIFP